MSTKAEVHKFIETEIRPGATKLLKEHEGQTNKLREAIFSLSAAIEKSDERMIRLWLKTLTVEEAEIANRSSRTQRLLQKLEDIEPDEGMVDDVDEIEKLTADLNELLRKLNKNYGIGKKLEDQANKALAAHKDGEKESLAEWAVQEAWIRKQLELAKRRLPEIEKLSEKAKRAGAERNEKALAEIQKASAAIRDTEPTFKEVEEGFEQFCEAVKPKNMSKELQDQFVRDRAAFQKLVDELGEVTRKILEVDSRIETMETAEVDYKKAAALLKIPSQYLSKLKAALEGLSTSLEKALDTLAKEAGLKATGKEMMALLRRAKMIA